MACLGVVSAPLAQAGLLGPTPYLSFNDSPFIGLIVGDYFHNETFEDGLLNTPGLSTASGFGGNVIGGIPVGGLIDSVDADDGLIDGSGSRGRSYFRAAGATGFVFQFSASLLGALPTHAGLVWTDGQFNTTVTFEAFDAANLSLGTIAASGFSGNTFTGQTNEDRFFGISHAGGISAIKITHPGGGIEVDHVQYGRLLEPNATVPEPTSLAIWGLVGLLATYYRRRRLSVA
jgi:hypothetical protein